MDQQFILIIIHQLLFQAMFVCKNILLRYKLGTPIRGKNKEANVTILYFVVFILTTLVLSLYDTAPATVTILPEPGSMITGLVLLTANLVFSALSLFTLGNSWRVGVIEDQKTELVTSGIYRVTRNPYFVSYILMFAGYTVILRNAILMILFLAVLPLIHWMIRKEERYLESIHGEIYRDYARKTARYVLL